MSVQLTAEQAETRDAWRAYLADEAIARGARRRLTDIVVKRYHYPTGSLYPRVCSRCKIPLARDSFNVARVSQRRANCAQCQGSWRTT